MTDTPRQLVRKGLEQAVDQALVVLKVRVQSLPPESQGQALQSAEAIKACLFDMSERTGGGATAQTDLVRLIFGHGDPVLVDALKQFTEVVTFYLIDARDRMAPRSRRRDA